MCLQLALSTQLPPNSGGVYGSCIFIHGNNVFPSNCLHTLLQQFKSMLNNDPNNYLSIDNIIAKRVDELKYLLPTMIQVQLLCKSTSNTSRHVRLLIIDSIASIFQCDFNNNLREMSARSKLLFIISSKLKQIAHAYNVAIVVTNDVRDAQDDRLFITNNIALSSSSRYITLALGLAWANCIPNRFFVGFETIGEKKIRYFKTIFLPYLQNINCSFDIITCGVVPQSASMV